VEFYRPHRVGSSIVNGYLAVKQEVRRAEGLVRVNVNILPKLVDSFQRALDSPDLAHLRKVIGAARGSRTLRHFDRHLASVVADLTTWQSISVPGAPLPVPYPEVVGQLMRSTPHEAQALLPDLFGDIFGAAYAKTVHAPYDTIGLRTRIDPVPNPDSRVTLATERDALGIPKARLDWRLSDLDHTSVRRTLEILGAEVGKAGLGRVRITLDANPSVWPSDLAGGWHHMGTTRMSDDPKRGVVDRNCQVHGIQNLYVAGSSVFPTAGSGTPTLTLVALSLRLAERLKGVLA
jgi:choline dehydrogenase-like flavoprotein